MENVQAALAQAGAIPMQVSDTSQRHSLSQQLGPLRALDS